MNDRYSRILPAVGLATGAILGMAGSFAPSPGLRGLAWGVDGIGIIVACAVLVIHHLQRGDTPLATGFLVFLLGETVITSAAAAPLEASGPSLAAGTGLWAAGLALVSLSPSMPRLVGASGGVAAILLAITSLRIFGGANLTPLSQPLPFDAFPFLALTLFGWAWVAARSGYRPAVDSAPLAGYGR